MFSFFKSASSVLDAMDCFRESLRFGALSSLSSSSVDFESKGTTDVDIFWLICSDAMRCDTICRFTESRNRFF